VTTADDTRGVEFDVIIAGARCAGAALATHVARAGLSVAVLDSAPLGSGQPNSTHLIQPPGMDELDLIGVGDQVRELTPALHAVRMRFDDEVTTFSYGAGRAAHCLRRASLDGRLQHAASEAGATLMAETRVVGLLRTDDGTVNGVEAQQRGGRALRLNARLVVGADGRKSSVAKLVGADEYLGYDAPRGCYWAYWRRPPNCDPHVLHNCFSADDQRVVFPTDGELMLIATAPPVDRARAWRTDHTAAYLEDILSYSPIASLLDSDGPVSEVRGLVKSRYFFRTAAGPGWALVGDAGHHKDFIIGLGISDALRDARELATAITGADPTLIDRFWRQRDVDRLPMYLWSRDLGAADHVNALERLVARRAPATPALQPRLGEILDGQLSPFRLIPPSLAAKWAAAELAHGRGRPMLEMLKAGVREQRARHEVARGKRRLRGLPSMLASTARPIALATRRVVNPANGQYVGLSESDESRCVPSVPRADV
jgi:2-polyprenyl-6-methoxyphenol hydroxylase-like FAD-dependent oxidoreductase